MSGRGATRIGDGDANRGALPWRLRAVHAPAWITSTEGCNFSNIAATTAAFALKGGKYARVASATFGGGNLQLQTLSLDGSTLDQRRFLGYDRRADDLRSSARPRSHCGDHRHGFLRSLTLDSRLRMPCARFARALTGNVAPVNPSRAH
jgi:hypothetical protein